MLGTRYGSVGTRFEILGTRIGSLNHLKKYLIIYTSNMRCLFLNTWQPTLQQSQLHFCTKQIMAMLWSLTRAAVILSLLQENNLSSSILHRVKSRTAAVNDFHGL